MSKIFWNVLKISPALLGASLLVANSTYAAESVTEQTTATPTQAAATVDSNVESLVKLPQTTALATTTPAAQNIPTEAAATSATPATALAQPTAESSVVKPQATVTETSVSPIAETIAAPSVKPAPSTLAQQVPASGNTNADSNKVIEQINNYNNEGNSTSIDQITNVTQLRDVSPSDWAYEALRTLIANYGCLQGYPDRTFRGNRALSRYEFAAGLNACLTQIERIITTRTANFVTRKDLETIQRLVQDFRTELTTLGTRLNTLEGRVALLEDRQFSTTTKLNGEVIFAVSDLFGNRDRTGAKYSNQETVLQDRVRLNFDTSFTGKDRLRTRLQAGNVTEFGPLRSITGNNPPGSNITREGRFGFQLDNGNSVAIEKLWYRAPITNLATVHLFANGGNFDDFVPLLNGNLDASGTGSISRFGRYNPIYRMGAQNAGIGLSLGAKTPIRIDVGYLAGQGIAGTSSSGAADPGTDAGLFNGSYSALGQVTFQPSKALALAATYVHSYNTSPGDPTNGIASGLGHGTGSIASQVGNGFRPVVGNSYGLEASFSFTPQFVLSGWAGYTQAIVLQAGKADVWNYGATLALNDFGTKGSTLGFVFGMEPKLTDTSNARVASLITGTNGLRKDRDTGFHVEGFYKFNLTRNISVTPGVIWLTAPGHDNRNDDIVIGTIRTTFTF